MFEFTLGKFQQSSFHSLNESDAKFTKTNHALSACFFVFYFEAPGNFSFFSDWPLKITSTIFFNAIQLESVLHSSWMDASL